MRIVGRGHSGFLPFSFETATPWENIIPYELGRSLRGAHATRRGSDSEGRTAVYADDPERIVRCRFELHTRDFFARGRCGACIGARTEDGGDGYSVLGLRAAERRGRPEALPAGRGGCVR